jgi:hypothetical protein
MRKLEWHLPIKTVSEMNSNEHWRTKSNRHRNQQRLINLLLCSELQKVTLPCTIKFVRLAIREIDEDNLPPCFKYIKDQICAELFPDKVVSYTTKLGQRNKNKGFTDNDKRIKWEYAQEKSRLLGIRIEVACE